MLRNLSAALLVLVAGCLAACSSGATTTPIPAPSTTPPASNPALASNGTDICALLPADQVAQITGLTIGSSLPLNNFLTANDLRCQYGDNNEVVIDVIGPGGAAYYDDLASGYGSNVSPVSGIGDKAFQDFVDDSGLVVLFGDTAYDVYIATGTGNPSNTMTDDQVTQASETLITTLKAKL